MGNQFVQACDVASNNRRLANYLLDALFVRMLAYPAWFLIGFFTAALGITDAAFWKSLDNPIGGLVIGCITVFVYYFLSEALGQRTLGKLITGTKVVTVNGTKPTLGAIAMRTLCRFVPFEPFSFFTRNPGGWHDKWSGTIVVRTGAAQYRQPQPLNYPAVNAEAVQDRGLQPLSYPVVNANLAADNTGIPPCEPVPQRAIPVEPAGVTVAASGASAPEPTCTAVAAGKTPCVQGRGLGGKTMWIVAGSIAIILGVLMMRSANNPVEPASASDTFDQTKPVYAPPSAPMVSVPSSAPSVYVPPSAPSVPVPSPAPMPVSPPSGLPATIQVDAVVVTNGKIVVYSDIGVLTEGQTVSGCKVVRITGREIVLKNGDAVHAYPLSRPDAGSN